MLFKTSKNPVKPLTQRGRWLVIIALLIFFGSAVFLRFWQYRWSTEYVQLSGQELQVLVAQNPWQWYRGLGKRESLVPYDGMIFVYPESGRHGIVMRDMSFSIDVVWFQRGEVVDIAPRLPLEPGVPEAELTAYYPRLESNLILELPAGWAEAHGLKIGDRITALDK